MKNKICLNCLLITFFGLLSITYSYAIDSEHITVLLETSRHHTTLRAQALLGDWKVNLKPDLTIDTRRDPPPQIKKTMIYEGEDTAIMNVAKGLIMRVSTGAEIDYGYTEISLSGGELLSIELPNQRPILLQGKIMIDHDGRRLRIRNKVDFRQFLTSSVSLLAPGSEIQTIKAISVMARTRLLYLKNNPETDNNDFDICGTHESLPFRGAGYNRPLVEILVARTKNLVLKHNNELIFPRYTHTCGGRTSSVESVFGIEDEPWHQSVIDLLDNEGAENCYHSPSFHWFVELSNAQIIDFLSFQYAAGAEHIITHWDAKTIDKGGRLTRIQLQGLLPSVVTGTNFLENLQDYFGINSIKSMRFTLENRARSVIFKGMGKGPGIGMCLFGADGLGRKNQSMSQILNFYYQGITIKEKAKPGLSHDFE